MMRRMRVTWSAMPPLIVTAPPESPVPAPRGTTGTPCLAATLMTSATCRVLDASTTASGVAPSMDASRSKIRRSLRESITASRPATRRSSSATDSGSGMVLESLEPACQRAGYAWRLDSLSADDEQREPAPAFLVGGHAVGPLEDRFLDAAVRRELDRVPDRQAVGRHRVMRLVDFAVDGQAEGPRVGRGAQPCSLGLHAHRQVQLKLGVG